MMTSPHGNASCTFYLIIHPYNSLTTLSHRIIYKYTKLNRGFAQAAVICYLLSLLSSSVDDFFSRQELPTQYTARNIAILIQTVVRGLAYLATFIFGANAVGLASLGTALVVAPDWVKATERGREVVKKEKLPDVKVTDDIFSLRRAFKEAEEMGRRSAERELRSSSSSSTSSKEKKQ